MTEFSTPIDIANRALQHCGANRISATLGFTENSKNASETAFAYPKQRRAELRRNVWRFATRKACLRAIDTDTMQLVPSMWSSGTTYFAGSIVSDQSNNLWISKIPNNLGYDPQNSTTWEPYFGPLTVSLWQAGGYSAGELVYTAAGDGTNRVFLSLMGDNGDDPATPTAYDAAATYNRNQVVTYLSVAYMSLIDLNTGNQPNLAPALYDAGTVYSIGNTVGASDGVIYTSLSNGNTGHDPVSDAGVNWQNSGVLNPWTTVFVGGSGSSKWLQIGGAEFPMGVTVAPLNIIYPIGTGPYSQSSTQNVYRLPNGYLRTAPQYPKIGAATALGGPSGITYNDWTFEGDYIVSSDVGPIMFRFVADVTDVSKFDDMFCEGMAARVALVVCEPLTQSSSKLGAIMRIYDEFMESARTANAIENGADVPPDDSYISCRY